MNSLNLLSQLKVACILDEFSYNCFKHECKLIPFTPHNWKSTLESDPPDILLVESAWAGNNFTWQYMIAKYNVQDKTELYRLLRWCREKSIPTVFWNKEDPFHFNRFIDTAKQFDIIFTTDSSVIPKYEQFVGHKNIFTLQFAAEPKIHNPIEIFERIPKFCFPGSYYEDRHEERRNDLNYMLTAAMKFGLEIYDRNYEKTLKTNMPFKFPEKYLQFIQSKSLKYLDIEKAYKGYMCILNVNSIKNSPTMFSRRIFEVLACGTPIISNYSLGLEKTIGKDIVLIGNEEKEYEELMQKITLNNNFKETCTIRGIRMILSNHTYEKRLLKICEKSGIADFNLEIPLINIISIVTTKQEYTAAFHNFRRQSYTIKKLYIITANDKLQELINSNENINTTLEISIISPEKLFNFTKEELFPILKGQYTSVFNPHAYYGKNYILDLINTTQYSSSIIIGKSEYFKAEEASVTTIRGKEYKYTDSMPSTRCIFKTELLYNYNTETIRNIFCGKYTFISKSDYDIFSSDKYNFLDLSEARLESVPDEIIKFIEI